MTRANDRPGRKPGEAEEGISSLNIAGATSNPLDPDPERRFSYESSNDGDDEVEIPVSFEPGVTKLPPQHLQETLRTTESKSQQKAVERAQRSARVAAGNSFGQQASASSPVEESRGLQDYNLEHAFTEYPRSNVHQHKNDNQDPYRGDSLESTEGLDEQNRTFEEYIAYDQEYLQQNSLGYPSGDSTGQSTRLSYANIRNPDVDPPSSSDDEKELPLLGRKARGKGDDVFSAPDQAKTNSNGSADIIQAQPGLGMMERRLQRAASRSDTAVEAAGIPEMTNLPRAEAVSRETSLHTKRGRISFSDFWKSPRSLSKVAKMMWPKKWIKNKLGGKMKSRRSRNPLHPLEEDVLTPTRGGERNDVQRFEESMDFVDDSLIGRGVRRDPVRAHRFRNELADSEASSLARPIGLGGRLHPLTIGVSVNTDPSLPPHHEFAEARFAAHGTNEQDDNATNRGAMTARGRLENY